MCAAAGDGYADQAMAGEQNDGSDGSAPFAPVVAWPGEGADWGSWRWDGSAAN